MAYFLIQGLSGLTVNLWCPENSDLRLIWQLLLSICCIVKVNVYLSGFIFRYLYSSPCQSGIFCQLRASGFLSFRKIKFLFVFKIKLIWIIQWPETDTTIKPLFKLDKRGLKQQAPGRTRWPRKNPRKHRENIQKKTCDCEQSFYTSILHVCSTVSHPSASKVTKADLHLQHIDLASVFTSDALPSRLCLFIWCNPVQLALWKHWWHLCTMAVHVGSGLPPRQFRDLHRQPSGCRTAESSHWSTTISWWFLYPMIYSPLCGH